MSKHIAHWVLAGAFTATYLAACAPRTELKETALQLPEHYAQAATGDTSALANQAWSNFYSDPYLVALIDTALKNNRELLVIEREVQQLLFEANARKGEYLPSVGIGAGAELDRVGRFTRNGAVEHGLDLAPDLEFPEPFSDLAFGAIASWEVDVWSRLRNARRAAVQRYLGGIEGRNFAVTQLVAEVAEMYFELVALDNQLAIVEQNMVVQANALEAVKLQKDAARVSQLAVNRFEAQLLNTRARSFELRQRITETENRMRLLTGQTSGAIQRDATALLADPQAVVAFGVPVQLLEHRPDIRQAERELEATAFDVASARAAFYPALGVRANLGYAAFSPTYLIRPESMAFNLAGDLVAPLVNRKALKSALGVASARQQQAVLNYEQTLLEAYLEVENSLARMSNMGQAYAAKSEEVDVLGASVSVSVNLFNSARADYAEVLLTQREALEARMEAIELRRAQHLARVALYRSLGGGWRP